MYDAKLIAGNDKLAQSYGAKNFSEIKNKNFTELIGEEQNDSLDFVFKKFVEDNYVTKNEISEEVGMDGERRIFVNNAQGIIENGKLIGVWGSFQDITEYVDLQERLDEAKKYELLGQLAGGVIHDFNNLLTVISGNATLASAN